MGNRNERTAQQKRLRVCESGCRLSVRPPHIHSDLFTWGRAGSVLLPCRITLRTAGELGQSARQELSAEQAVNSCCALVCPHLISSGPRARCSPPPPPAAPALSLTQHSENRTLQTPTAFAHMSIRAPAVQS